MNNRIQSRIRGMALGSAIGDALGMPLEFTTGRPPGLHLKSMIKGRCPAGFITDDTEMAIAMAEAMIERRGFDAGAVANEFCAWYGRYPADVGGHTSAVLIRMNLLLPFDAANEAQAVVPDSAGNGAIMRAWPTFAAYWASYEAMVNISRQAGQLTHAGAVCDAGMVFLASLVYELLRGTEKHLAVDLALINMAGYPLGPKALELRDRIVGAKDRRWSELPNTGWIVDCLEASVWAVLTTETFEDAIVRAVNLGNDADTTGAVTGMIAGALYGETAIPGRWLEELKVQWPIKTGPIHDYTFIRDLADKLYGLI